MANTAPRLPPSPAPESLRPILDFIWGRFLKANKWPTTRLVYAQWPKDSLARILRELGDGYFWESEASGGNVFQLSVLGILSTSDGRALYALFNQFAALALEIFYSDPAKTAIASSVAADRLRLNTGDVAMLGRLLFNGLFPGGGSHADDFGTWECGLPKTLENVPKSASPEEIAAAVLNQPLSFRRKTFLDQTDVRMPIPKTGSTQPSSVRIGMRVRLEHVTSHVNLKSFGRAFSHPLSSGQQMVVGSKEYDDSTLWIVRAAHGDRETADGAEVHRGNPIRLEHVATHTNLHSHPGHPAPVTAGQQEVTAFGSYGSGDEKDNWLVFPEVGDVWLSHQPVRLTHKATNQNLHSHSGSHPIFTAGYQEITAFPGRDDNDLWAATIALDPETDETPDRLADAETTSESVPYMPLPAAYSPDYCRLGGFGSAVDSLGVDDLAARLAELLALRETRLPLAVGLFGNWGSGKSHFMNLVDGHLQRLAQEGPADWSRRLGRNLTSAHGGDGPWCQKMVPIYFNAWHYLDANLWASLVTEIFDKLFAQFDDQIDERKHIQERLRKAGGATAQAEEDVADAQEAVRKASDDVRRATEQVNAEQTWMRGLIDGLKYLLPQFNTPENRHKLAEVLGVSTEIKTLSELAEKRREVSSLAGRARLVWRRITRPEGRGWRIAWIAVAGIGTWKMRQLIAFASPAFANSLPHIGLHLKLVLTPLVSLAPVIGLGIRYGRSAIQLLTQWQTQAESEQLRRADNEEVRDSKKRLAAAEGGFSAAQQRLSAAKVSEAKLQQELDEMHPERKLRRFIEGRARSSAYRGQLSIISLVRRDFEELSQIFAESASDETKDGEDGGRPRKASKISVERIVLFIDDLDRCEPEKVVEVLQAVHLLLAFPLFAVVVGVDQRCLQQSLACQFPGLLKEDVSEFTNEIAPAASPLDYLEKIFHIPIHLPSMNRAGFSRFIDHLCQRSVLVSPKTAQSVITAVGQVEMQPPPTAAGPAGSSQVGKDPEVPAAEVIHSAALFPNEVQALKDYYALIGTPRAATRLLNTYRLVRAGVTLSEWPAYCGDQTFNGECRLLMHMLAVAAGNPGLVHRWFDLLRKAEPSAILAAGDNAGEDDPKQRPFIESFQNTLAVMQISPSPALVGKWLDRVEQFTF